MISTRQGILNAIIGTSISLFNAIIQFLTIYFLLEKFGTEFNGFVKLVSSFSALLATAEGALGIATTILLVKPISTADWITANEVYSTSRKNYKKGAYVSLLIMIILAVVYPLYAGINGMSGMLSIDNWKNIGISLTGTNTHQFAGYLTLFSITIILGLKNFATAFWFGVHENIISADNKSHVKRAVILFVDALVYGVMFFLLSIDNIMPIIPFIIILIYSPLKGYLIYLYVHRKYPWLKYYRDFNSFKLNTTATKISRSTIGASILINTDVLIAAIVLGLNVSSTLSLYLVIAINIRLIMTNFITSFREYFVSLIAQKGRIYWRSYTKYELYTYLIVGFTFINMSIIAPYFVSSLYSDLANESLIKIPNETSAFLADKNALNYIFYSFNFSFIYAASTSLVMLCEAQITLIQAKGNNAEVTKVQNYLGGTYLVLAFIITGIIKVSNVGGLNNLIYGIVFLYLLKTLFLVIRYIYLWVYVWKYITYNSSFKNVLNNFAILLSPFIFVILFTNFLLDKQYGVEKMTSSTANIAPLIGVFFACIGLSILFLTIISLLFTPKMMIGILLNLPIINKISTRRRREAREKRLQKEGISLNDIVDKSNELSTSKKNDIEVEEIQKTKIYTIKG